MDTDEAWEEFRKNSERFQKASIAEKLDTLAAAINSIKTDTERTAEMVPTIMGDQTALDSANEMAMQSPAPEDPAMMGGDEAGMDETMGMPPEGGAPAPEMGGGTEMPMDAGAPEGGTVPGAEDMSIPNTDVGAEDVGSDVKGNADLPEIDDFLSEADIQEIMGGGQDDNMTNLNSEPTGMPPVGNKAPDIPPSGEAGLAEAANGLLVALKQSMHEAIDSGNMDKVMELSQIQQQLEQSMSNVTSGLVEPTPDFGGNGMEQETLPEMMPTESEGGPDVITDMPIDDGSAEVGGDEVATSLDEILGDGNAPEAEAEMEAEEVPEMEPDKSIAEKDISDEASTSDETPSNTPKSEKKDDNGESKKDGDTKDEKKDDKEDSEPTKKSLPMPSLKDMMANRFDVKAFMKSDREGAIDEGAIYKDPMVDKIDMEGVVDGGTCLQKSDSRIASARNIFDKQLMTGRTDPSSIATSGEAQEALNQKGTQDPGSIAEADPIMNIRKSEEDVASKPKTSGGSTDPDSIATAGTAQEALSHKGTQDPGSIAEADTPVNMNGGDKSEGTTTKPDIKIEKSDDDDEFSKPVENSPAWKDPNQQRFDVSSSKDKKEKDEDEPPKTQDAPKNPPEKLDDKKADNMPAPRGKLSDDVGPAPRGKLSDDVGPAPKLANNASAPEPSSSEGSPYIDPKIEAVMNREWPEEQPSIDNEPADNDGWDMVPDPKLRATLEKLTRPEGASPPVAPNPAFDENGSLKIHQPVSQKEHIGDLISKYGGNEGVPDTSNPDRFGDYDGPEHTAGEDAMATTSRDAMSGLGKTLEYIKSSADLSPEIKRAIMDLIYNEQNKAKSNLMDYNRSSPSDPDMVKEVRAIGDGYRPEGFTSDLDEFGMAKSDSIEKASENPAPATAPVGDGDNIAKGAENVAPANVPVGDGDNIAKGAENVAPAEVPMPGGSDMNKSCDKSLEKSLAGKHIPSIQEMFSIAKSGSRPSLSSSMGGNIVEPNVENPDEGFKKSETVRMGRGVDPMKVIENDLEQWNNYKARNKF